MTKNNALKYARIDANLYMLSQVVFRKNKEYFYENINKFNRIDVDIIGVMDIQNRKVIYKPNFRNR